ncbi:alcohol dehydrogenase family protein [Pelagimonas varians]|uniref:Crotonyl-CoA reductase n=1 Tax=Pelagimonas varians TaxID=696760 RepID=A0A238KUB7_9RHOB|nr:alcohol dehydrogenase family protein [Pelagimonas varians]PYG28307.1 NADPH:quinone reductase-like Zn-dependent oxidoreductase [Pelagimonas varians]SMX46433.1 Crotonyl-CoA reductase [Pelagimonas varians]
MMLPETMSGVALIGHGGPEMLEWRDDLPTPVTGPGDVIIAVGAAGVNNTDINTRTAWYSKGDSASDDATWTGEAMHFPHIQGADVCGRIVAVGDGVDPARIGQRVMIEPCLREVNGAEPDYPWYFGSECNGGFAQFTRVAARHAHGVDCDLTDIELASFPCSYSTAENMLTRSRVAAGDTVLVTGASGGVGSAAVQLAQARGATVIAQTSASKADSLRALGAAQTVDRGADLLGALGGNSVDVVIDLVAGPQFPTLLDILRPRGRYAVSGAIAGPLVELDVRTLYLKDLSFFGCTVLEPEVFGNLIGRIERQEIKPLVAETYALRDIAAAQQAFGEKGHVGKIVLEVG